jgi:hypothetical protein
MSFPGLKKTGPLVLDYSAGRIVGIVRVSQYFITTRWTWSSRHRRIAGARIGQAHTRLQLPIRPRRHWQRRHWYAFCGWPAGRPGAHRQDNSDPLLARRESRYWRGHQYTCDSVLGRTVQVHWQDRRGGDRSEIRERTARQVTVPA